MRKTSAECIGNYTRRLSFFASLEDWRKGRINSRHRAAQRATDGEEGEDMLLHYCRCGKKIPQGVDRCEACRRTASSRFMEYNRERRDKQSAEFYVSRAWRIMRARMCEVFNGVDIVAFYEEERLRPADMVHHIEPLKEAWEKRLDPLNLLPMSEHTHRKVEAEYGRGPEAKKACQDRLRECRERWFRDHGGVEKVFAAAGLVSPPLFRGENSPPENPRARAKGG